MRVLVTGAAGFIGYHIAKRLLIEGNTVVGLDNFNDYYDVSLKEARIQDLTSLPQSKNFQIERIDLADTDKVLALFEEKKFTHVINLAAQAGVRYSLKNPFSYFSSNIVGFGNILEGCRNNPVEHLVYASSSSVYGFNTKQPFSVLDPVDHPVSLYAASKKSNELMAHAYSHLFGIPSTGLRLFTVYGPWGRPDMALHLFATAMCKGEPIQVFNQGHLKRDFTYIDDIIECMMRILVLPPKAMEREKTLELTPATSYAPWRVLNIGNSKPVPLLTFIALLEKELGVKAKKHFLSMQPGDVTKTWASMDETIALTGFTPMVSIEEGVHLFVHWFRAYYSAAI